VTLGRVAHAQGIAVCEIFRNVAIVVERDERALPRKANVEAPVFLEAMRMKMDAGLSAAAYDSEKHAVPPGIGAHQL
jgi:hypothetical protein